MSAAVSQDATADAAASVILKFEEYDFELFRVHISSIQNLLISNEFYSDTNC